MSDKIERGAVGSTECIKTRGVEIKLGERCGVGLNNLYDAVI